MQSYENIYKNMIALLFVIENNIIIYIMIEENINLNHWYYWYFTFSIVYKTYICL